jgi:hypothetical protein
MSEEPTRDTVKVEALKERIGQIVASYEDTLANLRTDATIQIAALNATIDELREVNDALKAKEATDVGVKSEPVDH